MTVNVSEAVLLVPNASFLATQLLFPDMLKVKGPVVSVAAVAMREALNHQLRMLGGQDMAEQLKWAWRPLVAYCGP